LRGGDRDFPPEPVGQPEGLGFVRHRVVDPLPDVVAVDVIRQLDLDLFQAVDHADPDVHGGLLRSPYSSFGGYPHDLVGATQALRRWTRDADRAAMWSHGTMSDDFNDEAAAIEGVTLRQYAALSREMAEAGIAGPQAIDRWVEHRGVQPGAWSRITIGWT